MNVLKHRKKKFKDDRAAMRDSANLRDIIFQPDVNNQVWVEFRNSELNSLYHATRFDKKTAKEFCSRLMAYFNEPESSDGELDDFTAEEWNKIAKANRALVRKAAQKRTCEFDVNVFIDERPYAGRRLGEEPETWPE